MIVESRSSARSIEGKLLLAIVLGPVSFRLIGVVLFFAVASAPAMGMEDAPDADSQEGDARIRPSIFHLDARELAFEFESQFESRRVKGTERRENDYRQRNRDLQFGEIFSLRLGGDVVDPRLVRWDGAFRLGLRQERFDEEITSQIDRSHSAEGVLLEYDLSVDMMSEKPLSAHAFARHIRDRIPRRFLPSLLEERSEAGSKVFLLHESWTSELGFDWSDAERSGNRAFEDDEYLQARRFYADNRWTIDETQNLRLSFDHDRQVSDYQGSRSSYVTDRDDIRLEHDLSFGDGRQHRLGTFFRWSDERGDLARDETELTPRLSLRHSDWFETIYRYSYYRHGQEDVDLERHKVDWQAVFRPDQRFRFTSDLFALWEDFEEDIETHQFGGGLHGSFRQPTNSGDLSVLGTVRMDQTRNLGSGGERVVRGEGHALDPSYPTFLNEPDILQTSIVAYNTGRTRLYLRGTDFIIRQIGRRTLAYRTLTGRIGENEAVLFDYRYVVPAGARLNSYWVQTRVEHAFHFGVTPYYSFDLRRQEADGSRGSPVEEDNTERHRLGMNWNRRTWSINAETELLNDPFEPYLACKLYARATLLRTTEYSMDGAAHVSYYDFTGRTDRRRVPRIDLELRNEYRIDPRFQATVATYFRWEDNSRRGETTGVDLECGLHYQRGQLGVDLTFEYDLLSIVDSREDGFGVWLTVRRDLSHLISGLKNAGARNLQ